MPWLTSPSLALIAVIMVNIWIGIPFNLTMLYGGLQDIPEELYEAGCAGRRDRLEGVPAHHLAQAAAGGRAWCWCSASIYTLKVLDIILGLTGGGPANATQTIATQSYQRSFVEFKFGQGAALGNILIVISLVFAIVYLRATRRQVDE